MNIKDLSGYSLDENTTCIHVIGEDSEKFLQGQFSNDITQVTSGKYQYSSYSTNQGKVISIIRILKDQDAYLLLINKDIAEYFINKLSMYILMSKVEIKEMEDYKVFGVCGIMAKCLLAKDNIKKNQSLENELTLIFNNTNKYIPAATIIVKNNDLEEIKNLTNSDKEISYNINELIDNLLLIPRITMETKESHIPQVLNLEDLGGINYKKGCYTGQEIVARTHYLGKIKKKIFLLTNLSLSVNIGDKLHDKNGEIVGDIFSAVQNIENTFICLGIIKLDTIDSEIFVNNQQIEIFSYN